MMMMMQMFFTVKTGSFIFFKEWTTFSVHGLTWALLLSFVGAALLEGIAECQYEFLHQLSQKLGRNTVLSTMSKSPTFWARLTQSIINMLRLSVGYLLMLAVMSFNLWILICVVIGAGFGYCFARPIIHVFFRSLVQTHSSSSSSSMDRNQNNGLDKNNHDIESRPSAMPLLQY